MTIQARIKPLPAIVRPFVRVEISSSTVPGDPFDLKRWYRYEAGLPIDQEDWQGQTAILRTADDFLSGSSALQMASVSDSLSGQSCRLQFLRTGIASNLAGLMRPQDRIRIEIIHPLAGRRWTAFDGLVQGIHGQVQAGESYRSGFSVTGVGVQFLLQGAVWNWHGMVNPASDVYQDPDTYTLMQQTNKTALPPQKTIELMLHSVFMKTLGLLIGDTSDEAGLKIMDYVRIAESGEWYSFLPDIGYPLPWNLIQSASGMSFWDLFQAMAEPCLHEMFVGLRFVGDSPVEVPALIHRPRPFPGMPQFDNNWLRLWVTEIGGPGQAPVYGMTDDLTDQKHANCFHWNQVGAADASKEVQLSLITYGYFRSDSMINRYGFSSVPVSSGLVTFGTPDANATYFTFGKAMLEHFGRQDIGLPFLRSRSYDGVFFPVRPGHALVDHSAGPGAENAVTGYVTGSSLMISASGDGFTMSHSVGVDRCIVGTDFRGYPDAVRALVPDFKRHPYQGKDIGPVQPDPAVGAVHVARKAIATKPEAVPASLQQPIADAAARQGIPGWLVTHVLHNESALGKNLGNNARDGVGQITDIALADLHLIGYTNPDGTAFTSKDRGDPTKCTHATAACLKRGESLLLAGGMPSTAPSYWSWVARAYRWGAGATLTYGRSVSWGFPPSGEAYIDYGRYWSPASITRGQAQWGGMGS